MRETPQRGVALVITLIFLSVITILAVAFLALSGRGRLAVRESNNRTVSEQMADIGFERAKAEILERILNPGRTTWLGPELMVSVNRIYDTNLYTTPGTTPEDRQAIASLWETEDPRPPVFVDTNRPSGPPNAPLDFRFFLDLNRNVQFESNGLVEVINANGDRVDELGNPVLGGGLALTNLMVGDPEWVGVLTDSSRLHSRDNKFLGRWAFFVAPIGRGLDLNCIHNHAKRGVNTGEQYDGFHRNQGFGPWEINLAAFLADLNTNEWALSVPSYAYNPNLNASSTGFAFEDALDLLNHRYWGGYRNLFAFEDLFGGFDLEFESDDIDGYADSPPALLDLLLPVEDDDAREPWPGAPNITNFFSIDDLLDDRKIPGYAPFVARLRAASDGVSTYDRYTFYRMLAQMGTDSAPERRRQVNLNYQNVETNSVGLGTNFLYATAGGNPAPWTPQAFFNTVANELLGSDTNLNAAYTNMLQDAGFRLRVTNIPVFINGSARFTNGNPTTVNYTNLPYYLPRVQQLLQIAANIYDATVTNFYEVPFPFPPSVFQPVFTKLANGDIFIVGYEEVAGPVFYNRLKNGQLRWWSLNEVIPLALRPGYDFFYEIPLIVGAKKYLPNFNEFIMQSHVLVSRKLEVRKPQLSALPNQTNEMFIMGISNTYAVEAWYPYTNGAPSDYYPRELEMWAGVSVTSNLTNEYGVPAGFPVVAGTNSGFVKIPKNTWGGDQVTSTNRFKFPTVQTQVILSNAAYYVTPSPHFEVLGPTNWFENNPSGYTNRWGLSLTNRLLYFLFDVEAPDGPHLVDVVTLNGLDTYFDISTNLFAAGPSFNLVDNTWGLAPYGNVSEGVYNQLMISLGVDDSTTEWLNFGLYNLANGLSKNKAIASFRYFVDPKQIQYRVEDFGFTTNQLLPQVLYHQAPFSPSKRMVQTTAWQVNDPLVHYTLEDVRGGTNISPVQVKPLRAEISLTRDYNLGKVNDRYQPWGGRYGTASGNRATQDPGMWGPDQWEFPEHKFPNVGWLGRVHRGTPWQTIYLKSDVADRSSWLRPNGPGFDMSMHPVRDWELPELFTVALHPDMTRGRLSISQTNLAAWSAVLSGVPVTTLVEDGNGNALAEDTLIEPGALPGQAPPDQLNPVPQIVAGIISTLTNWPGRQFTRLGDILAVPELTVGSPYLSEPYITPAAAVGRQTLLRDSDYERIPQQILSLLQVGEPRFVVYAFGQSLIPAEVARQSGPNFGMPINYRITGEMATRTVLRVDYERRSQDPNDPDYDLPDYGRPHIVVERFNLLPVF